MSRLPIWTPEYPGAIVYPAEESNCLMGPGWEVVPPTHIVYHTPEEPADDTPGTPYWFAQYHPNQAGSTNAFADWLGNLWECVPPTITPIANGVKGKPYPVGANPNINLNRATRSIEVQGYAHNIDQTMPRGSGQWNRLVSWGAFQSELHNIPIDRNHHIGHYEVANDRTDPGTLDLDALVHDIYQFSQGGFLMALSDAQQLEVYNGIKELRLGLRDAATGADAVSADGKIIPIHGIYVAVVRALQDSGHITADIDVVALATQVRKDIAAHLGGN